MPRDTKYNEFGTEVSKALASRRLTQSAVSAQLNVTVGYVNNTMTGRSPSSSTWADLVADVLKMSARERARLHVAAAKSAGYKLDLTPPTSR